MRASIAMLTLTAALAAAGGAAAADSGAPARADALREFNIAAQALSQALRQYAEQSGDQVVFYSDVGAGRESQRVEGRYTPQEALQILLRDTGLKAQRVNAKTVAITADEVRPAPESAVPIKAAEAMRLAQANQVATTSTISAEPLAADSRFGVEEIIVTGTAVADRTKFESSVAISTFNAEEIARREPMSSADLIAAVPGFWVESTAGTTQGNVFARGIIQDGGYRYVALMEDGIPLYPVSELAFYNPDQFVRVDATIERVEALRGGPAPIFTAGAVGGAINFVSRAPSSTPSGIFRLGVSDYGLQRADVSWSGPLGDAWRIAFGGYYRRANGVRDPGYDADRGGQFRVGLSRSFDRAELDLFAKYIDDRSLFVVPVPLTGDPSDPRGVNGENAGAYSLHSADLARVPLPSSAAQVGLQDSSLEDGIHPQLATAGARLHVTLSERAALTNLFRYTSGDVRFDGLFSEAAPVTGAEFAMRRGVAPEFVLGRNGTPYAATGLVQNHGHWAVNKDYLAWQNDFRLGFALDSHALTLGAYAADYSMLDRWTLGNLLLMDASDRPERLLLPGVTDAHGYTRYSFLNLRADYEGAAWSLYASDEWQATKALRLDLGVRYDAQETEASISNAVAVDLDRDPLTLYDNATSLLSGDWRQVRADFDAAAYSFGFNYQLTDRHALFGHYSAASKLPHFDDVRNGVLVEDNVDNVELGYKTALDDFVMFATLFQTQFDNVPFQDILVGGATVVRRAQTRTRGLELEGELQPLPALTVRFSMTLQDPEYRNFAGAALDNTGNTIRRIPKSMARITPTLTFMQERARAWLTYTYAGERYANDENTIRLPSYSKVDAGVMLDVGEHWTLQLTADNLTDEAGLTEGNPRTDMGAGGIGPIYMARPLFGRSFTGSATYRY
jgi:outer membrane receptor protein involved in Fe transport